MNMQIPGFLALYEILKNTLLHLSVFIPVPDKHARLKTGGSLDLLFRVVLHCTGGRRLPETGYTI